MDVPIHFPNAIEKFQVLIEEPKNRNLVNTQHLEEIMTSQTMALANQVKIMVEKTKAIDDHAQALIVAIDEQAKTTTELAKAIIEEREQLS